MELVYRKNLNVILFLIKAGTCILFIFSAAADPGCLSRIRPFFGIPDPDPDPTVFYPGSGSYK
jgi:hypothetical protein